MVVTVVPGRGSVRGWGSGGSVGRSCCGDVDVGDADVDLADAQVRHALHGRRDLAADRRGHLVDETPNSTVSSTVTAASRSPTSTVTPRSASRPSDPGRARGPARGRPGRRRGLAAVRAAPRPARRRERGPAHGRRATETVHPGDTRRRDPRDLGDDGVGHRRAGRAGVLPRARGAGSREVRTPGGRAVHDHRDGGPGLGSGCGADGLVGHGFPPSRSAALPPDGWTTPCQSTVQGERHGPLRVTCATPDQGSRRVMHVTGTGP